jgi:hypothetical protein
MTPTICMPEGNNPAYHSQRHRQPGLVIPAGFTKSGLPLSLHLVGYPFGEAMLYLVAQFLRGRDRLDGAPSPGAFRRILAPGENIRGPTEQMLFLKECRNA